jgi:hypothetical protein
MGGSQSWGRGDWEEAQEWGWLEGAWSSWVLGWIERVSELGDPENGSQSSEGLAGGLEAMVGRLGGSLGASSLALPSDRKATRKRTGSGLAPLPPRPRAALRLRGRRSSRSPRVHVVLAGQWLICSCAEGWGSLWAGQLRAGAHQTPGGEGTLPRGAKRGPLGKS